MKSGSALVLGMIVAAALIGAYARFHTIDYAPINLGPGDHVDIRVQKKATLVVTGEFSGVGILDLDWVEGEKLTTVAREWKGEPLEVRVPTDGCELRVTNRHKDPASEVRGKVKWKKKSE